MGRLEEVAEEAPQEDEDAPKKMRMPWKARKQVKEKGVAKSRESWRWEGGMSTTTLGVPSPARVNH